jgi:hypothetical protein
MRRNVYEKPSFQSILMNLLFFIDEQQMNMNSIYAMLNDLRSLGYSLPNTARHSSSIPYSEKITLSNNASISV